MATLRHSWLALLLGVICALSYNYALGFEAFRNFVGDDKGLSGVLLVFPLIGYVVCLIESFRVGWSFLRPLFVALLSGGIFVAHEMTYLLDGRSQPLPTLVGALFWMVIYTLPAFLGEAVGQFVRYLTRPR
ncbi:hypothetical protein [Schaalia suimastitidis]|uniref:hypothetical protein n=1 Tax=Schaalia suimastitidis TaxID=121163 RepID=UPI0004225CDD|nr:hypothetical protein [Schaalia suimastitidis]